MAKKCVIFDVDGVLLGSQFFTDFIDPSENINISELSKFFSSPGFAASLIREADTKKEILPFLDASWRTKGVEALLDFWHTAEDKPIKEMNNYLEDLSQDDDILIAIATNQEQYRTAYLQSILGNYTDVFISSSLVGSRKPDKEFYESLVTAIHNEHSIPLENMIFWDDTPANIECGNLYGIPSHLFTDYKSFTETMDVWITK